MSEEKQYVPPKSFARLADDERHRLLLEVRASRPQGEPVWVFGFGSLMWRPEGKCDVIAPAYLKGYERQFRIWSLRGRGSPENPGLGLCLEDCAGGCHGLAYRLIEEHLDESFDLLWKREMGSGVYKPTWVSVDVEDHGRVPALTFVINRAHQNYTGPMPIEVMANHMCDAYGENGRNRDYLASTVEELRKLNKPDPFLEELLSLVEARCGKRD